MARWRPLKMVMLMTKFCVQASCELALFEVGSRGDVSPIPLKGFLLSFFCSRPRSLSPAVSLSLCLPLFAVCVGWGVLVCVWCAVGGWVLVRVTLGSHCSSSLFLSTQACHMHGHVGSSH